MQKIIFLDIDGVLNSNFWNENHQRELSDGTLIDEDKVYLLSQKKPYFYFRYNTGFFYRRNKNDKKI